MTIDYTGAEGGRLAAAFAAGCTATWVFVRNLVMKPAIRSCHQQIADLRERIEELKAERERERVERDEERGRLLRRVEQLETILMMHGNGAIRAAVQSALSEQRIETEAKIASMGKKIGGEG